MWWSFELAFTRLASRATLSCGEREMFGSTIDSLREGGGPPFELETLEAYAQTMATKILYCSA